MANKITIAQGMTEIVKSKIQDNQELNKLERAIEAMTDMTEIIVNRRSIIYKTF